ncbi:MAG: hypothetical protein K6G64_00100 [Eubacterium sp.]|nr:hypothetical protein [Eubacterium sp.]
MKRRGLRRIAVTLTLAMMVTSISGCGKNDSNSKTESNVQSEENVIYGEVAEVAENSIKIKVGTMNERQKPGEKSTDDAKKNTNETADQNTDQKTEGRPSMINLTGEEQEISFDEETKFTKEQMMGGFANMGTPPQMPDSKQSDGEQQTPPQMPDSKQSDGEQQTPPQMPDSNQSEAEEIASSDISEGDIVKITLDDEGNAAEVTVVFSKSGMGGPSGQPGGQQAGGVDSYTSVNEYTSDKNIAGESVQSSGTDENAILVSSGNVTLDDVTVTRTSSDSTGGDNSSFYGVGAAVLTTGGTSYIKNNQINTDAAGGAGIFAYKDGTVYVADTTVQTKQDTSGGIHVAGGGKLYAWDMDVETNGQSSAAIRSDRGGGTMVVDGGTYTSNGKGSPAIYSTADITVNDADLTATGSEAICIEGLNSIRLFNSNLSGNMKDDSQNDCTWNVILYQSMSGDSEVGNSTFEMNGGTLTAKNGGMFYTTNTESTFVLKDVDITYAKDNDFFLKCTGNSNQRGWGTAGQNGADCSFTAISQEMEGDVIWDSISQLDFYMTKNSILKGSVVQDETNAGNGGDGTANIYIEKGSKWIVTGDSTVTNLYNAGTIVDSKGKTVTVKGTDGTIYVKGSSSVTVTVTSYSTKVDVSKATKATSWTDYKVEKPEEIN